MELDESNPKIHVLKYMSLILISIILILMISKHEKWQVRSLVNFSNVKYLHVEVFEEMAH